MRGLADRRLGERNIGDHGPISRAALQFWVRAEDVLASPVETWPDISGQNNDFTQPTSGNRPTLVADVINGYPAVLFDGDDDWLGSTIDNDQPLSWAGVAQIQVTGTNNDTIIGSRNPASTSQPGALAYVASSHYALFAGSNMVSDVDPTSMIWVRFAVSINGASTRFNLNGFSGTANPGTRGAGLITLGAFISGGARTGFWPGYIAEMIGWDRALPDTELTTIMDYFASKYDL